ncbi:MAG: hypothetical protein JO166_11650 [Deltaproteobacteria bacterium]|nr:hypothetical protein [Deltaproteobacteria bacterium]
MLSYEVVVDERVLAAFEEHSHAETWGSRYVVRDEVRSVAEPDWRKLVYLVFDGHKLVAAFALRDDAQHWIEECGNHAMELRQISAPIGLRRPRRERAADKNSDKRGGLGSRKR